MLIRWLAITSFSAALLTAQDFSGLPDWAAQAARSATSEAEPKDADAWVLFDRTEIAYTGDGEIRQHRFRVAKVLTDRGATTHGVFVLHGLGGRANKVKKMKGWNLRPDGSVAKLDSDTVVTINDTSEEEFSTSTMTGAVLPRVVKGSYVAFESLEAIQFPIGPVADVVLMESVPVRRWELDVAKKEGWFTDLKAVEVKINKQHFAPWITKVEPLGTSGMGASNLPALPKGEGGHPHLSSLLPVVKVRFLDPAMPMARMWGRWDDLAKWNYETFARAMTGGGTADLQNAQGLKGLHTLWAWMARSLTYKAVYLTPERGWIPEVAGEVGRKRYGDCKDLSSFFMTEAKRLGFDGAPALARISIGGIEKDEEPYPVFNHVISALRLNTTLGLPAEVETARGRFLLVDPTDPYTPLGQLGSAHRGRRVMICLPEGAEWVTIPDTAILRDRLDIQLEGEVKGTTLQATIHLRETGDYWGLRASAHQKGVQFLRNSMISQRFDLPATSHFEIERMSDPLDLSRPFEVDVKITHLNGFRRSGEEFTIEGWGVPNPPSPIQKAGVARQYPVERQSWGELNYHAVISVPERVQPILPVKDLESAFRVIHWTAKATPSEHGSQIELHLDHRYKPVLFDFEHREQGLLQWKQDRNLMKSLHEDGLAFKADSK